MAQIFIAGIGTEVGKTLVSAIVCRAWNADYWKPIQCGDLDNADAHKIASLSPNTKIHATQIELKTPASPHHAAQWENKRISISDLTLPQTKNHLVIEAAGGILVPLNEHETMLNLAQKFTDECVLVSRHYLGSINHTLLTINELKRNNLKIKGIVFVGEDVGSNEEIILKISGLKKLISIPTVKDVNREFIDEQAKLFAKIG